MNRLVLIGNGFDLAHGLNTRYSDFIKDFWKRQIDRILKNIDIKNWDNGFISINTLHSSSWNINIDNLKNSVNIYNQLKHELELSGKKINIINDFLSLINNINENKKWVDIEIEYYNQLKKILNFDKHPERMSDSKRNLIIKLNKEFEAIKSFLIKYLEEVFKNHDLKKISAIKNEIGGRVYERININEFTNVRQKEFYDFESNRILEFLDLKRKGLFNNNEYDVKTLNLISNIKSDNKLDIVEEIKEILKSPSAINKIDLLPDCLMILNFNYTTLYDYYLDYRNFTDRFENKFLNVKYINIHGEIENSNNPIIFGYGDELDEDYKKIENLNENNFLENVKSIKYLETDNYKKLLEFIESDEYQVYIMGHSCGISDRTLLNTIFEHDNCISIKPFYHKKSDTEDNYQDIIQNISRNFTDKVKMRDRVVNKTYCQPLS